MPTQPKTLADLAAEAAEIDRQKAALQLPVLEGVKGALTDPAIAALLATLESARGELLDEHAKQLGYLIATLTNVPNYVVGAVETLDAIVNPPAPIDLPTPPTN